MLRCGEHPDLKRWSPRLESNQYPTLRRHVHYPLCYGEDACDAVGATTTQAGLQFGERALQGRPVS